MSLLFTGVGSVIGSGWLFGALYASQLAGPLAIFAWVLGGIMFAIIALAYAELAVMFPVAGGVVRFPQYAFGSFGSYSCGWLTWLAAAGVTPIEVLATMGYAQYYFPDLMYQASGVSVLTPQGIVVSVILMFIYSLINVLAVKAFAYFNNVLVWWKLGMIVLVVVLFFVSSFHPGNLTSAGGFAPNGISAMFVAIATAGVGFAYLGFRQGIEFAGETDNPQRNVPFAVLGTLLITTIIYVLLQIAFITGLTPDLLSNGWANLSFGASAGPLAGLALALGIGWLATLLFADAIISPADTGLIYAAVTARLGYANGQNRNAPQWLTKLNRFGVPWLAVVLMFVVGCIFFLPFPGWRLFVGFVTQATVLSFGSGPLVVGALRRRLPAQERPFKLPGGDVIPCLAFICCNLIVYWGGWASFEKLFIGVLVGYIIFVAYNLVVARGSVPPIEFKHGAWFIPWVVGMLILLFIGSYGHAPEEAWIDMGGLGWIPRGWSALVIAAFSIGIYAYAVTVALPADKIAAHIRQTPTQAPGEEAKASA